MTFLRSTQVVSVAFVLSLVAGAAARADEWKDYTSQDGRFSVDFPGTPKQAKEPRQTKFGRVDAQLVILSPDKGVFFGVIYLDYPESVMKAHGADELLDGATDSAVKAVKGGRVAGKDKVTTSGNAGRELTIDAPGNLRLTMRMYLVKNRLYQVISSVTKDKEKDADPKRFFDSFKLGS